MVPYLGKGGRDGAREHPDTMMRMIAEIQVNPQRMNLGSTLQVESGRLQRVRMVVRSEEFFRLFNCLLVYQDKLSIIFMQ
jgi:hypothetical protein